MNTFFSKHKQTPILFLHFLLKNTQISSPQLQQLQNKLSFNFSLNIKY